jgi:NADH dehydrogenase/NADH:ubiquinone oxidoreductase subunit G
MCIVEVIQNKRSRVVTACLYPITREVDVKTNTEKILGMRKTILRLLSARAPENEYINKLLKEYGMEKDTRFKTDPSEHCILCGLCVKACEEMGNHALATVNRGITKKISTPFDEPAEDCIGCSACAEVCPTGAIKVTKENGIKNIWGKDFKLMKCESCGAEFITQKQYVFIQKKLEKEPDEKILCPKCKKKLQSEKFKDIYEDVKP